MAINIANLRSDLEAKIDDANGRVAALDTRLKSLETDSAGHEAAFTGIRRDLRGVKSSASEAREEAADALRVAQTNETAVSANQGAIDMLVKRLAKLERGQARLQAAANANRLEPPPAEPPTGEGSEHSNSCPDGEPSPLYGTPERDPDQEETFHLGASERAQSSPFAYGAPVKQQVQFDTPKRGAGRNREEHSFSTAVDHPDDGLDQDVLAIPAVSLGPFAPGLRPMRTMVHQFAQLVDYRLYRLTNTSPRITERETRNLYDTRKKLDLRYPNINKFSGSEPLDLFAFVADLRDALDSFSQSEGAGVLLLGHYLEGEARSLFSAHTRPGAATKQERLRGTWPYIVHGLLEEFLTDDLLRAELKVVSNAEQYDGESVGDYARRLSEANSRCRHVYPQTDFVHAFILGLHPGTRSLLDTHLVRTDTSTLSFHEARSLAHKCEQTVRLAETRTPNKRGQAVHHIPPALPSPPSTPCPSVSQASVADATPSAPDRQHQAATLWQFDTSNVEPEDVFHVLDTVQPMFTVTEPGDSDDILTLRKQIQNVDSTPNLALLGPTTDVPRLTQEQVRQAMSAIPADYWSLNCWTCRGAGHSSFTCPYLTATQRIFFALCYYRYLISANPRLADWYEQKQKAKAGEGPHPGRKPPAVLNNKTRAPLSQIETQRPAPTPLLMNNSEAPAADKPVERNNTPPPGNE